MKLRYFVIALICLFNPVVSNIDIIPDFIGYLLIMKALSKPAYIYGDAEDAYISARKMCLISFVKAISVLIGSLNDASMSLLLSFSFFIVELIFGIPFLINLFKFMSKISVDIGNSKSAEESTVIKYYTIFTVIVRLGFAFLPDLTALTMNNGVDTVRIPDLTGFRPTLFILTSAISFLFCLVWLVISIVYFKRTITKDFTLKCEEEYQIHSESNKPFFEGKRTGVILFVIIIGSIFLLDFGFSYYVITPDFIASIIAVCCFIILYSKKYQKPNPFFWVLCGSTVMQVIAFVLETVKTSEYYSKYTLQHIGAVQEANDLYNMLPVYSIFTSAFSVLSTVMLMLLLYKYGKNSLEKHSQVFQGCDYSYQLKEYKEKMRTNIICVIVFALISATTYTLNVLLMPVFSGFIFINIFVEIVFIILVMRTIFFVHDEVYKRITSYSSLKPLKQGKEA